MSRHLTTDELLDRLYGIGARETESHFENCAECGQRYAEFERRRAEAAAGLRISTDALGAQRRAVYARIEQTPGGYLRWAPAVVALLVLALGLLVYRPPSHTPAKVARPEANDEQLFSDVYSIEQSAEPRAAAPIHAMFEDTVFEEGGQQ